MDSSRAWTHLHVAFGDIEWADDGVSETASENAADNTFPIVGGIMGNMASVSRIPLRSYFC